MKNKFTLLVLLFIVCECIVLATPRPKRSSVHSRRKHLEKIFASPDKEERPVSLHVEPRKESYEQDMLCFLEDYTKAKYKKQLFDSYLFVSLKKQRMFHVVNNQVVRSWVISGSKFGTGNNHGSNRTPIGLHSIVEKYGYNAPKGGLMVERNFTGKVAKIHKEKYCVGSDDVTTRILWLRGEEPGLNQGSNVDSYKRFIYIHGTPEEGLIGVPSSEGCIRMKNSEVMDLFNFAYVGMKVLILDEL